MRGADSNRILLVKRDKLGDLLLTRPVISALARALPHAEIHLLANDYNAWVARDHPGLARTWVYPRARSGRRLHVFAVLRQVPLMLNLRRQRFDWALVLGGDESHRAIRRAIATGASRIVAYAHERARYGPRLTDALPPPHSGHEIARMLALLAPLGVRSSGAIEAPTFDTAPYEAALSEIDGQLAEIEGGTVGAGQVIEIIERLAALNTAAEAMVSSRDDFLPASRSLRRCGRMEHRSSSPRCSPMWWEDLRLPPDMGREPRHDRSSTTGTCRRTNRRRRRRS